MKQVLALKKVSIQTRVRAAAERAAGLNGTICWWKVLEGSVEADDIKIEPAVVSLTLEKINALLVQKLVEQK